jgi:hypothetical protein
MTPAEIGLRGAGLGTAGSLVSLGGSRGAVGLESSGGKYTVLISFLTGSCVGAGLSAAFCEAALESFGVVDLVGVPLLFATFVEAAPVKGSTEGAGEALAS